MYSCCVTVFNTLSDLSGAPCLILSPGRGSPWSNPVFKNSKSVALLLIDAGSYHSPLWFFWPLFKDMLKWLFGVETLIFTMLLSFIQKWGTKCCLSWEVRSILPELFGSHWALCSVSPVMVRTSSQDQVQGSYRLHVWSWCNSWAMGNLKIWFWTSWNSTAESFESHMSSLNYFKVCCKGVSSISPNICNLKCVFFSQIFLQSCPLPRKLIGPWTQ